MKKKTFIVALLASMRAITCLCNVSFPAEKPEVLKINKNGRTLILFDSSWRFHKGDVPDADVWLNGTLLGTHPYGYTSFSDDVTSKLKAFSDGLQPSEIKIMSSGQSGQKNRKTD